MMELKPAIFLHIQKTAGSTFVEIARGAYGNDKVISHGDYYQGHDLASGRQGEIEACQKRLNGFPFISGHFGYDFARYFMQDRYSFTFLRNPAERILSFYFFCRNSDPEEFEIYKLAQQVPLEKFLKQGLSDPLIKSVLWNHQVNQLAFGFGSINENEFTDADLLALAEAHLNEFSYVGFTETFGQDRDNILSALGIHPPIAKIIANANPGRPVFNDLPSSAIDLLLELTELDQALYQSAWARKAVKKDLKLSD